MAPYAYNTLNGLIQINDENLSDAEVSDLLQDAPLLAALHAQKASNGTKHQYLKEVVAAGAAFRNLNTGVTNAASQDEMVSVDLKILDAGFDLDRAAARVFKKMKGGQEKFIARESKRHLRSAFALSERQILNGTGNAAGGFQGLADELDALADAMTLDAGGTASGTIKTSVYLIRTGESDVSLLTDEDGMIEQGETAPSVVEDENGRYDSYRTPILGWLGLQFGSVYSCVRIVNITDEAGKGVTDDLIAKALELFPSARQPNLAVMNRKGIGQLRGSRTATNATGAPAPYPESVHKIPIILTDSVLNTEEILTDAA